MGNRGKQMAKRRERRAAKAGTDSGRPVTTNAKIMSLTKGLTEAFARIENLQKLISPILEEHEERLDAIEKTLGLAGGPETTPAKEE